MEENKLANEIRDYLQFLRAQFGWQISIHSPDGHLDSLSAWNGEVSIHSHPYCMYMKSHDQLWDKCKKHQRKVMESAKGELFWGCCYCGVGEYVAPIRQEGKCIGFVSIGASAGSWEKMRGCAEKYGVDDAEKLFFTLNPQIPEEEKIRPAILVLVRLLEKMCLQKVSVGENGKTYIFGHIQAYLKEHFREKISVEELACFCHCSYSYISHLFRVRCGVSIPAYVNQLRVEEAKRLLKETECTVTEIAFQIGFDNSNYFSNVFRKIAGCSPREYRRKETVPTRWQ